MRLVDFLEPEPPPLVRDLLFVDCDILGPAVVVLLGTSSITNCSLGGEAIEILWELPSERQVVVGAIGLQNVQFDRCRFHAVGFAGNSDFIFQMIGGSS